MGYIPLKIGLLGVQDPSDIRSYSGTPFHLGHYLRAAGHQVRILGPYPLRYRPVVRFQNRLLRIFDRQLVWERHKLIADQYPGVVTRYADRNPDLDVLLGTSGFYLAKAKANLPLAFWGDTTIAGVINGYTRYTKLSKHTIQRCHAVEQDALTACNMAIYSSSWAAELALKVYKLDPAKVRVITYGANLIDPPNASAIAHIIERRDKHRVKCIHVGWDWYRKGVDKAIQIVGQLRTRGLNAELQIVGCSPPSGVSVPDYVRLLGVIPKTSDIGRQKLAQLLSESHLMILPTIAECAAVVLTEANAFGVPVVSSDVGGNSSLIRQYVNGILLPPAAEVSKWTDAAIRIVGDRDEYERFAVRSHQTFEQELSWPCAVKRFEQACRELLRVDSPSQQQQLSVEFEAHA